MTRPGRVHEGDLAGPADGADAFAEAARDHREVVLLALDLARRGRRWRARSPRRRRARRAERRSASSKGSLRLRPETDSQSLRSANSTGAASVLVLALGRLGRQGTSADRSSDPADAEHGGSWSRRRPWSGSRRGSPRTDRADASGRCERRSGPRRGTGGRGGAARRAAGTRVGGPAATPSGWRCRWCPTATRSLPFMPPKSDSRQAVPKVERIATMAAGVQRQVAQRHRPGPLPTLAYPAEAHPPWRRTKARAATPAEVTTRPTLKTDRARGWRFRAWATTTPPRTRAPSGPPARAGRAGRRNPRRGRTTSDWSSTKSMMGQTQLAAMSAPKTTANTVSVALGRPLTQRRRAATREGHGAGDGPDGNDDPRRPVEARLPRHGCAMGGLSSRSTRSGSTRSRPSRSRPSRPTPRTIPHRRAGGGQRRPPDPVGDRSINTTTTKRHEPPHPHRHLFPRRSDTAAKSLQRGFQQRFYEVRRVAFHA